VAARNESRFAAETEVPVERTRAEIERLIIKYGATSTAFMNAADRALILFEAHGRRVCFELPLPRRDEQRFTHFRSGGSRYAMKRRSPEAALAAWEQACRQRWRALRLVLLAKFEAAASGITDFESEFLAHIILPDGQSVAQHVRPRIAAAYSTGTMKPLLPSPGGAT